MTHQFKFGDRVRDEQGNEFIVIREEGAYCEVINTRGKKNDFKRCQLTPAHTDDTARLDWLAAQDDIDITLGNVINLKQPDLRTAIDIAMQACIAAVAIEFAAHFEEMVARGEAERLPDGHYRIFEKAT